MKILAIETSCDETSSSVIDVAREVVNIQSNIVSSQVKIHEKWGGVVPNLAAREHVKNIIPVINESLEKSKIGLQDLDLLAVTQGPGLIPALLIGTNAAKTFGYFLEKPLIGINHMEAHIYANFFSENNQKLNEFEFPILCLIVSGGHTQLVLMKKHLQYEIIGETQDDAVGEAFDKVAKILELSYPGGPVVSKTADQADEKDLKKISNPKIKELLENIELPRPMLDTQNFHFSFSGLKTSVLYFHKKIQEQNPGKNDLEICKKIICKKFQEAAVEVLVKKSQKAIEKFGAKTFLLAGGVAANSYLRDQISKKIEASFNYPPLELCGDNAGMIAVAAHYRWQNMSEKDKAALMTNWKTLEADSNLRL